MAMRVDLNADVGESFGAYIVGNDAALMPSITSANIAAGFHGGDPSVLRTTVQLAKAHGVAIGAHPGFPDLAGFGRREMRVTAREAEDLILYQIAAVAGVASAEGAPLAHVKAHGALFHMAARDRALADALARAVAAFNPRLRLFAPPDSEMARAAEQLGLTVVREAFADRAYLPDGRLVSRQTPGSVIQEVNAVVARAVALVVDRSVMAVDGSRLALEADTICVHGDTPGSDRLAAAIRRGLEDAGVTVAPAGAGAG
jgi:UPF0271 protein